jgi:hypothetical protein
MSGNQNTILWLTPHAAVARESRGVMHWPGAAEWGVQLLPSVPTVKMFLPWLAPLSVCGICDVVLRLLAASVVHSLVLISWSFLFMVSDQLVPWRI